MKTKYRQLENKKAWNWLKAAVGQHGNAELAEKVWGLASLYVPSWQAVSRRCYSIVTLKKKMSFRQESVAG